MWWHPDKFESRKPYLLTRMAVIKAVRAHFDAQGFWEVETPALQVTPGLDTYIHGFKTTLRDAALAPVRDLYLHTSPEFAMKKLLCAGAENIYQICKTFRDGEDTRLHSPEFTMIEWYRMGADYTDIMRDCTELLRSAARAAGVDAFRYKGMASDPFAETEILTVCGAFERYAGISLEAFLPASEKVEAFSLAVQALGIRTAPDDSWDDIFFRVMADRIEPFLGADRPCILTDYPSNMAALARRKPEDARFSERFELYVCGVELANAFGELTDPVEQRARFIADMAEKQRIYGESYPLDEDFLAALAYGMPQSSGIALGVDRLIMLASGAEDISQVLWAGKP